MGHASRGVSRVAAYLMVAVIIILASVLAVSYQSQTSTIASLNARTSSDSSTISRLNDNITSLNAKISSLNAKISNLQATLSSVNSQLSTITTELSSANSMNLQLQSKVASLQGQLTNASATINALRGQVSDLQGIVQLKDQTIWVNQKVLTVPPNSCNRYAMVGNTSYAGYLGISVLASTTPSVTVGASWSAFGIDYSDSASPGSAGTALFIVLPTNSMTYEVCNYYSFVNAMITVTVTYYF